MTICKFAHFCACLVYLGALLATQCVAAAEPSAITIASPQPHQVFQRIGFASSTPPPTPPTAPEAESAEASPTGAAVVLVTGSLPEGWTASKLQYRIVPTAVGRAPSRDNDAAVRASEREKGTVEWRSLPEFLTRQGSDFRFQLTIPGGGWYRLELQSRADESDAVAVGVVEPFGVGEVFLVAGQSYATNTNDEPLQVADAEQRVVAFDTANNSWRVAHDPQPTPDHTDGGSIWPAVGDLLAAEFNVPIAFANVAYGGTSSTQWLPDQPLHANLRQAGSSLGRFRAVLWQQGESDVIEHATTEQYIVNLKRIRKAAARSWGFEPPWVLAKSTHHPTVYNDPEGENRIRLAVERLSDMHGFAAGPDTDTLRDENRGGIDSRRHFSAIGQRRAAELWFQVLAAHLRQFPTGSQAAAILLPDLHLLHPAWASETVVRESSIVLQSVNDEIGHARLAFPAAEIIEVAFADRQRQCSIPRAALSEDRSSLILSSTSLHREGAELFGRIVPVAPEDLFPPKGSPNSYAHRVDQPEQNLLYQPGRWFHDRNVEITYRRDLNRAPLTTQSVVSGALPKTMARLQAGEPLTIGISGDSISTGLDASIMTAAPPFQPGYAELVAAQLQVLYDSEITVRNRAVAGWSVANGVEDLDALLAEQPQLIIVAYGMNDVGRRDPKWFGARTHEIIERVQAASPDAEVILVASMLGNKEWVHTPREMFALYRDELLALVGPGVAVADVSTVWELMLERKHDLDLTGNGLNHPNDFGHRLYAQALLQLLTAH